MNDFWRVSVASVAPCHGRKANRLSHCIPEAEGWEGQRIEDTGTAHREMDGAEDCARKTHKGYLSPPSFSAPNHPHVVLLTSEHVLTQLGASCKCGKWKMGAASWECHTDQHLHTPHKPRMLKRDSQTLILTNTSSVYVGSSKNGQLFDELLSKSPHFQYHFLCLHSLLRWTMGLLVGVTT